MYARTRIYHGCLMWIEKSIPQDHCLASLGIASWCQTVTVGWIFQSAPHTHERFLISFRLEDFWTMYGMYRKILNADEGEEISRFWTENQHIYTKIYDRNAGVFSACLYESTGRAIAVTMALASMSTSALLKMLKFLVKVFKSLYLLNPSIDLVDTFPDVRYWSKVLCCTITTHISDLRSRSRTLKF